MQRRRLGLLNLALALPLQRADDPLRDIFVMVLVRRVHRGGGQILAALGGLLVFLGDGGGFEHGREPGVLQEHGVGGAEVGDFVEAAGGEVVGGGGEGFGGEVGWFAVDDGLRGLC